MPALNLTAEAPLADWLHYIEHLDPSRVELGLDRVERVYSALGLSFPETRVVLVAGTNGKGSTATLLARLGAAAGLSTGLYTSPHFFHFNERIEIDGHPVEDDALVAALAEVDSAAGNTTLTYFEMTTLAALQLYQKAQPRLLVLEIGLGGRLDAVNVMPAELGIVTTIGLDHTDWLGETLAEIAREKAGIVRPARPLLVGAERCSDVFQQVASAVDAELHWVEPSSHAVLPASDNRPACWIWRGLELPVPRLPLASALLALEAMRLLGIRPLNGDVARVLSDTGMPGRMQELRWCGRRWVLDVAHNADAAAFIAGRLHWQGPWQILLGQLQDKDVGAVVQSLLFLGGSRTDAWQLAGLNGVPGGLSALALKERAGDTLASGTCHGSVAAAIAALCGEPDDRPVLVCGSFHTVAQALVAMQVTQ